MKIAHPLLIGCVVATAAASSASGGPPDVPLTHWTSKSYPEGLSFGDARGISWADYDADGWPDVFTFLSGELWHNDSGTGWTLAADLDDILPPDLIRYGASFGDYNADGLPDLAVEPRIDNLDSCFHLLENRGPGPDGPFVNVTEDQFVVINRPCGLEAETACWGDVNGDGTIDLFLPVYAPWEPVQPSIGNRFFKNTGPVGDGGSYQLVEMVDEVGLFNTKGSGRPEGAQFADVDHDGDLDLYSNGTLYRNESSIKQPQFVPLEVVASGIGLRSCLDEGAAFFDYDMDGDLDLAVVYECIEETRIWESRGDGTFFHADGVIQFPFFPEGHPTGMSVADWDNDGDLDFTTDSRFRRNLFMEQRLRRFTLASNDIPDGHRHKATPAWADWDNDGDLDCALGNYGEIGRFYENTLYDASTPREVRRFVRVRPLRDAPGIEDGVETEFGATAEIFVQGDDPTLRRRAFAASSGGYLNQNEYPLHFGLPDTGEEPLVFDVVVDFPSLPVQGRIRVDKTVNPVLGLIDLLALPDDREIDVFRSGRVRIGDTIFEPVQSPQMHLTGDGLVQPSNSQILLPPAGMPTSAFVGMEIRVGIEAFRVRIREIILDGQVGEPIECGDEPFNLAVWDVTDTANPTLHASSVVTTSPRNDRTHLPASILLLGGRHYRVVTHMLSSRLSPIVAPSVDDQVTTVGGLVFTDDDACSGHDAAGATVDVTQIGLALQFSQETLTEACPDLNIDGVVDELDVVIIIINWGDTNPGNPADLTGDGEVDIDDLIAVVTGWGPCS